MLRALSAAGDWIARVLMWQCTIRLSPHRLVVALRNLIAFREHPWDLVVKMDFTKMVSSSLNVYRARQALFAKVAYAKSVTKAIIVRVVAKCLTLEQHLRILMIRLEVCVLLKTIAVWDLVILGLAMLVANKNWLDSGLAVHAKSAKSVEETVLKILVQSSTSATEIWISSSDNCVPMASTAFVFRRAIQMWKIVQLALILISAPLEGSLKNVRLVIFATRKQTHLHQPT